MRRPRELSIRFLLAALCLVPACSSPSAPEPTSPPVDSATGIVLDDAEVASRVERMESQDEPEAETQPAPPSWKTLDEMPVVDLVEPADDATIARWIHDLGEIKGDASRKARQKLLEQGLRVADRLREPAKEEALRGLNARSVQDVLSPGFARIWTLEDCEAFTTIEEGRAILGWTGDPPRNLIRLDTTTGRTVWTATEKDFLSVAENFFGPPRKRPQLQPGTGRYIVGNWGNTAVSVNPKDGTLAVTTAVSATAEPSGPLGRFWIEPNSITLPDKTVIQWSVDGVRVRQVDDRDWSHLTIGRMDTRVHDVGVTPFHFYALLNGGLTSYNPANLKIECESWAPPGSRWMHVSARSGLIVVGGRDWTSLAVLGGHPPRPLGRCPAQVGRMRAMASDREGRWIATADDEGFIRVFLAETLERVAMLASGSAVDRLEFASDPPVLLAVSEKAGRWLGRITIQAWSLSPAK